MNLTFNGSSNYSTTTPDLVIFSETQWWFIAGWMAATALVGFIGNAWVLITILKHEQLHEPAYYLIANLSLGDVLLGLVYMVGIQRNHNYYLCQFFAMISPLIGFQTLWTLMFISYDRKIAICDPLHYMDKMKIKYIWMMIAASWISPTIMTTMPFFGFGTYLQDPYISVCQALWISIRYSLVDALYIYTMGLHVFPLIVVVIRNYWKIYKEAKKVASLELQRIPSHNIDGNRMKSESRKISKVFAVVLGIFFVTWTPYIIIHAARMFGLPLLHGVRVFSIAEMLSIIFFQVSSYINPFIYGIMNRTMRKYMLKLLGIN